MAKKRRKLGRQEFESKLWNFRRRKKDVKRVFDNDGERRRKRRRCLGNIRKGWEEEEER